jgi:hypothetical protein
MCTESTTGCGNLIQIAAVVTVIGCGATSNGHELLPSNASLFQFDLTERWYSPHFTRKSLRGGVGSGAVRRECVLVGGLKGCYWWKTV